MLCAPKLRRELSLPYYFINDRTKINVPLWYRLKFDEVLTELKKKRIQTTSSLSTCWIK